MDWKYKHFNQQAVFNAPVHSVLEAARSAVAGWLPEIQDTSDGFIARGFRGWRPVAATCHVASAVSGTQVTVELLAERFAYGGYMLFDIGGYYNAHIDQWFTGISERLGGADQAAMVSKTTPSNWVQRGILRGCLVWLVGATCLGVPAIGLDRAVFPQSAGWFEGPFGMIASLLAFLAGALTFIYFASPDSSISKSMRAWLQRTRGKRTE